MNQTAISVFGFSVVLVFLWVIVVVWGAAITRKIYLSGKSKIESPTPWFVWQNNRGKVLMWVLFLLVVCFYTSQESAWRPARTVITNPAQHQIDTEMRQLDEAELTKIKPAEPMSPIGDSAKSIEQNKKSNKDSRDAFNSL